VGYVIHPAVPAAGLSGTGGKLELFNQTLHLVGLARKFLGGGSRFLGVCGELLGDLVDLPQSGSELTDSFVLRFRCFGNLYDDVGDPLYLNLDLIKVFQHFLVE